MKEQLKFISIGCFSTKKLRFQIFQNAMVIYRMLHYKKIEISGFPKCYGNMTSCIFLVEEM